MVVVMAVATAVATAVRTRIPIGGALYPHHLMLACGHHDR